MEVFWLDLNEAVAKIPKHERIILVADMNGHVREGNNGDEECMCSHRLRRRNDEGQAVVDFAKRMGLATTYAFVVTKPAHKILTVVAVAVHRWITL